MNADEEKVMPAIPVVKEEKKLSTLSAAAAAATSSLSSPSISCWKEAPLNRHLSTLGIGEVFLNPPPIETLYHHNHKEDGGLPAELPSKGCVYDDDDDDDDDDDGIETIPVISSSPCKSNSEIKTWEIVGTIKSYPEDFIVREIGGVHPNLKKTSAARVALLTDTQTIPPLQSSAAFSRGNLDSFSTENEMKNSNCYQSHENGERDLANVRSNVGVGQGGNEEHERKCNALRNEAQMSPSSFLTNKVDIDSLDNNDQQQSNDPKQEEQLEQKQHQKQRLTIMTSSPKEAVQKIIQLCLSPTSGKSKHEIPSSSALPTAIATAAVDAPPVLFTTTTETTATTSSLFDSIQNLYQEAIMDIEQLCLNNTNNKSCNNSDKDKPNIDQVGILISPIFDHILIQCNTDNNDYQESTSNSAIKNNNNRRIFHQSLKIAFPLLKSITLSEEESANESTKQQHIDNIETSIEKGRWIRVVKDTTFHHLIQFLAKPNQDLIALYRFRNHGCQFSSTTLSSSGSDGTNQRTHERNNQRYRKKRSRRRDQCNYRNDEDDDNDSCNSKKKECHITEINDKKDSGDDAKTRILLRLDPLLPRERRREVHHFISRACRDFETGTMHDVPLSTNNNGDGRCYVGNARDKISTESRMNKTSDPSNFATTTAIVVRWSKQVQRMFLRKRKRNDEFSNQSKRPTSQSYHKLSNTPALLFILKKKNVEHQVAINHLVSALKCRPSDIGLAGIKDMRAVTFQFCTLRNVNLCCVKNANQEFLRKSSCGDGSHDDGVEKSGKWSMEIGNYEWAVDYTSRSNRKNFGNANNSWFLNIGDLKGNLFEIVIRDLRRVVCRGIAEHATNSDNDCYYIQNKRRLVLAERMIPCDAFHINSMVERVRNDGFINYYGEQRVGNAGLQSEVGVRSVDIGRAMLKKDFRGAINLLMTGRRRNSCNDLLDNGADTRITKVRQAWVDSNGDPLVTLASFPSVRNSSFMTRERTVLQGLKRYGKNEYLSALKCLHHNVRMFWINAFQSYVWNIIATERIRRFGNRTVVGDLYMEENNAAAGDDRSKSIVKVVMDNPSAVSFRQVVLPLPGHNIDYPTNEIGHLYRRVLDREGIEFSKESIAEATAKGSYRYLVTVPGFIKWQPVSTVSPHDVDSSKKQKNVNDPTNIIESASFQFSLRSGSYATMLLRELMVTTISR